MFVHIVITQNLTSKQIVDNFASGFDREVKK